MPFTPKPIDAEAVIMDEKTGEVYLVVREKPSDEEE